MVLLVSVSVVSVVVSVLLCIEVGRSSFVVVFFLDISNKNYLLNFYLFQLILIIFLLFENRASFLTSLALIEWKLGFRPKFEFGTTAPVGPLPLDL